MTSSDHPTEYIVRAYAAGRLAPEDAASLDGHFAACDECCTKLAAAGSDTFSDLLREAPITDSPAPASLTNLPPELQSHPRYEVQQPVGRGGMGVVYRARHRMMHRPVALKLIRPELLASPQAVARFRAEVRAAAKLTHPNIVTAYDAEEVAGVHFLVMEFVEGKTLDEIVNRRGPLPVSAACQAARQAALGLAHAHSHGLIHRDIKPHNLIVAEKSKVKILDFGLAIDAAELAVAGGAAGTRLYAAPEQMRPGDAVSDRADQYGLGATLHFLLSGEPPRKGSTLPAEVPDAVRAIVARLMAVDPDERFSSMKDVADALAPWSGAKAINPPKRNVWRAAAFAAFVIVAGLLAYSLASRRGASPPASASSSQQQSTIVVDDSWQSLMAAIDPAKHSVVGNWRKQNGQLAVAAGFGTRIMIPVTLPPEYDLRVRFTRRSGTQSVGAVIVQNGRQVVCELDAWNQNLAGFQNIGGRTLQQQRERKLPLTNDREYSLRVEVRRGSLAAFLNDAEFARHASNGSDLSVDARYWAMPDAGKLGLVAWNSDVIFHAVELRKIGSK